ncbi:MAG: hypothetical protein KJ070_02690 [Verrucomicrobia bacterium]|nr:hypothetical protein [Verrucomicrobiota bacterium]
MKAQRTISLILVALVLPFGTATIHGQSRVIRQHFGATDPTSEGFTLSLSSGSAVGPVTNDYGRDSWKVISLGTPAGYLLSLSASEQASIGAQDVVLSATMRIVQSLNIWLGLYTASQGFEFSFASQADGDPIVRTGLDPIVTLEGGGPGYHDYQIVYRAATARVDLWVDGVERVSNLAATGGSSGWGGFWGAAQGPDSQAN